MLWSNISSEFCLTSLRRPAKPSKASFIFYPVFKDAPVLLSTVRKAPLGPLQHPAASTTQDIQTTIPLHQRKKKFEGMGSDAPEARRQKVPGAGGE
jgi:hypothetical protein